MSFPFILVTITPDGIFASGIAADAPSATPTSELTGTKLDWETESVTIRFGDRNCSSASAAHPTGTGAVSVTTEPFISSPATVEILADKPVTASVIVIPSVTPVSPTSDN